METLRYKLPNHIYKYLIIRFLKYFRNISTLTDTKQKRCPNPPANTSHLSSLTTPPVPSISSDGIRTARHVGYDVLWNATVSSCNKCTFTAWVARTGHSPVSHRLNQCESHTIPFHREVPLVPWGRSRCSCSRYQSISNPCRHQRPLKMPTFGLS